MMSPTNAAKVEAARRAGKSMVGAFYKRMRPPPGGRDKAGERVQRSEIRFDGDAGCLRTAKSGGSNVQNVMIVDSASVRSRRLSPREAGRLMGMLDAYKLPGNYTDAYDLMGDGVVVPVVRHLAEHILEPILKACGPAAAGLRESEKLLLELGL
jgi:DNA (cytosine-5)-methyltransferase 1